MMKKRNQQVFFFLLIAGKSTALSSCWEEGIQLKPKTSSKAWMQREIKDVFKDTFWFWVVNLTSMMMKGDSVKC